MSTITASTPLTEGNSNDCLVTKRQDSSQVALRSLQTSVPCSPNGTAAMLGVKGGSVPPQHHLDSPSLLPLSAFCQQLKVTGAVGLTNTLLLGHWQTSPLPCTPLTGHSSPAM